jgi:hypothetical protein
MAYFEWMCLTISNFRDILFNRRQAFSGGAMDVSGQCGHVFFLHAVVTLNSVQSFDTSAASNIWIETVEQECKPVPSCLYQTDFEQM